MNISTKQSNKVVIPGECLFSLKNGDYMSGKGTYVVHEFIYASLAGFVHISERENEDENVSKTKTKIVSVRKDDTERHSVPFIGSIVTAKILNIGARFAKCSILFVENSILTHPFNAKLRREDIRSTERNKIEMQKCVRPRDILLARVIGLGEQHHQQQQQHGAFLLSSAEDQLGVLYGISDAGFKLLPISWTEMQCSGTGDLEPRKVAKVPGFCVGKNPEYLQ